ncbi:protein of unknown function [Halogranum amylolyticum]|uniref:Protein-glutamine gamma-glutamyltransferase-like C-terminal domain-containing protein n=1 Tax=Halogranum amylolyticum TaxID=660520 RepID=A0A1H8WT05_9EURY|nr:DUF4129 domain-containing protein [Halogranum amylolyticum]SEP30623.1 protein of unknown function [Halogranum amylolyticum]
MRWERLADVGLAVALVFAFGVSAAAMDSAVTTDPNDVINLDTNLLPIGSDQFGELKQEVVEPTTETGDRVQRRSGSGESGQQVEQEQAGSGEATIQSGGESDTQTGTTSEIDWLQWLLRHLLQIALLLLGVVGAVVTGVLAGRNRDRLRELFETLLARLGLAGTGEETETDADLDASTRSECSNEVARAWYEMVCCLGLDGERSKTPDECAARAVDAGYDPEAVRTVTEAFQSVRYGGHPVTEDLVAQARAAAEHIRERHQQRQRGQES